MKFTIIIPVYNVATYLRGCLESVLDAVRTLEVEKKGEGEQWKTDPLVEIICVDDGSTDGSGAILDEYAAKDARLKVIHQQNAGVSAARNRGIEEAKGEWVIFVDGDDQMIPETLSFLAKAIERANFDFLQYGCAEVYAQDVEVPFVERPIEQYDMRNVDDVPRAVWATRDLLTWNGCFRRALIGDVRFKKMHPGEDSLFANEMLLRAKRIAVTNTVLYRYLQRPDSVMHVQRLPPVLCSIESLELRYKLLSQWEHAAIIRPFINKMCRTTAGQIVERLRALTVNDRMVAWKMFVEMGRTVFSKRFPYNFAFRLGNRGLIDLLVFRQYVLRRAFVRLRRKLRG